MDILIKNVLYWMHLFDDIFYVCRAWLPRRMFEDVNKNFASFLLFETYYWNTEYLKTVCQMLWHEFPFAHTTSNVDNTLILHHLMFKNMTDITSWTMNSFKWNNRVLIMKKSSHLKTIKGGNGEIFLSYFSDYFSRSDPVALVWLYYVRVIYIIYLSEEEASMFH